jgi:uncharacterized membrane protein YgaE (UPF0421/DUF939 family)
MENRKQDYLDLLNRQLEALNKMLTITKTLEMGTAQSPEQIEEEAERFCAVYEQRADVILRIQLILETLKEYEDLKGCAEGEEVTVKIKAAAKALVEMDKKNIQSSAALTVFLRDNLKKIKESQGINHRYNELGNMTSGHHFDSKN